MPGPVPAREITQPDIDAALQEWNGDMDSKRRVRYMTDHGREKGTADWLRGEHGDDLPAFPVTVEGAATDLPWSKVQRHLARLVKEDRFFTEQELDNFEDIDPAAIREQLESGQPSAFVEQVMADVERIAAEEQTEDAPAEPAVPAGQPIQEEESTAQEVIAAADPLSRDPLAPVYSVGDTVYLNDTAFEITDINLFDVQLRDPALAYPILRSENKENFERLLRLDSRNGHITQYLSAGLASLNDDLRDVLTNHLLPRWDKISISGWLRSGMDNRQIAQRMSLAYRNREDTVTLETGDIADYRTSNVGMSVEIQDKFGTNLAVSWEGIAPVIRTLWLQELDGFSHVPEQQAGVELEGRLSYQVGDKVAFGYGNHDVKGTIEGIGAIDVVIRTGTYAWSHQTVSKNFFEEAVRHDERNAHLFTQEPEQARPAPGPDIIYPGDKNGLPFDVIVQRLPVDEPEQAQAEPEQAQAVAAPTVQNFRITDDHLGEGGLKEKFRRNLEAVTTLHEIKFDNRTATQSEQEIMSRYVGWGALADAFDPKKPDWANEYKELQVVLTPEEYESARTSTLNSHYTSPTVIKAIYEAVGNMGFTGGNILDSKTTFLMQRYRTIPEKIPQRRSFSEVSRTF